MSTNPIEGCLPRGGHDFMHEAQLIQYP